MKESTRPGITLILGGARSGKSAYALEEANRYEGEKAFIATAEALDADMKKRIARHRSERGPAWRTFEEPVDLRRVLSETGHSYPAILIDCLTLWVSNLLLRGLNTAEEFEAFASKLIEERDSHIFIVSNEVGMGIVPEHPLGRVYRDELGTLNRAVARVASRVVLMIAGIPVPIKGVIDPAGPGRSVVSDEPASTEQKGSS